MYCSTWILFRCFVKKKLLVFYSLTSIRWTQNDIFIWGLLLDSHSDSTGFVSGYSCNDSGPIHTGREVTQRDANTNGTSCEWAWSHWTQSTTNCLQICVLAFMYKFGLREFTRIWHLAKSVVCSRASFFVRYMTRNKEMEPERGQRTSEMPISKTYVSSLAP